MTEVSSPPEYARTIFMIGFAVLVIIEPAQSKNQVFAAKVTLCNCVFSWPRGPSFPLHEPHSTPVAPSQNTWIHARGDHDRSRDHRPACRPRDSGHPAQ